MKYTRKVSIRGGFSDRNKIKPLNTNIQFESLDEHSRNSIAILVLRLIQRMESYIRYNDRHELAAELLVEIFNEPVSLNSYPDIEQVSNEIRDICLSGDYDDVLSIVEKLCNIGELFEEGHNNVNDYNSYGDESEDSTTWFDEFNQLFEREFIGYKFINNEICRITSSIEIESIENSTNTEYDNVNEHMKKAISFIKATGQPDYKNSIKECSLALECLLNIVIKNKGFTLNEALNQYIKIYNIHPALKESLSKFYGFVSDSSGIRHDSNKKDYGEGFDEAKLILVNTSSFINYIISTKEKE